jgi:glycosyltransferase involved in cell wall biosynthesis
MKILFCTQCALSRELGGSKVALEVADAMKPLGWECEVRAIPDIHAERSNAPESFRTLRESLRSYLLENAGRYDVVDFDHAYLPHPRREFSATTLLVARSVLLLEHFPHVRLRVRRTLRGLVRGLVRGRREELGIESARATLAQADLINVPNDEDRARLMQSGIPPDKIVVIPYGIWRSQWPQSAAQPGDPGSPTMVFLGTFDYRKGCLDLVDFAKGVFAQIPGSRLKLLGTRGMVQTEAQVRAFFPRKYRDRIEIVPKFQGRDLPALLRGATLGIFPSYLEGFGMAVVEMVAAGIPVLAYRVPGPSSILPPSCLVERGDVGALTQRTLRLLGDAGERNRLAHDCARLCQDFDWPAIGQKTSDVYRQALQKLRC